MNFACYAVAFLLVPVAHLSSIQSGWREPEKVPAEEKPTIPAPDRRPNDDPASIAQRPIAKEGSELSRDDLENTLVESLTGAVLEGIWQMTGEGGLRASAPLTEPKQDRYTIARAAKVAGDSWVVVARIEFADNDVTLPVPVRVLWAGDTPVITVDDLGLPLLGRYSARVMIHEGFYSGIWYSREKNYGGTMSGRIVKGADQNDAESSRAGRDDSGKK